MTNPPGKLPRWPSALLLLGLVLFAPVAYGQDKANEPGEGVLRLLPEAVETRHQLQRSEGALDYRAVAGTLPLRDGKGGITAEIFFVSYTLDARAPERPITFVFNGGPGAASAFLHLGAMGPRIVSMSPAGEVPPPPARVVDNPDTWLAFTDLVFVDPVGTGYSRTPDPDKMSDFWGVDQDASSMAAFIRLYLARTDRTGSPIFLAGESYGGFRVAVLAHELQSNSGIAPSGVVMVSPALEFALLRNGEDFQPLPDALALPSFAAVARERTGTRGADALVSGLADVERFALSDYLLDLVNGYGSKETTLQAVARFTGLSPQVVKQQNGRIPVSVFVKELARPEGRVLSPYDGTVSGPDPDPESSRANGPDPILDRSVPAYSAAFVGYVRGELGYRTDVSFRLLDGQIAGRWDYGTTGQRQGYAGAMDDLEQARTLNPAMKVFIAHGYTDLVTPYFATRYLIDQLPPLAGVAPVELRLYEGGHMMYMRSESRHRLADDVRSVYERHDEAQ